jgi:hypothetical protein
MVEQLYLNTVDQIVACRFQFPLDEHSAIYSFEAVFADVVFQKRKNKLLQNAKKRSSMVKPLL